MARNVEQKITTPTIVTPFDENRMFVFNQTTNKPVYVAEIPGCRFNGLPICLATNKRTEVAKVTYMLKEFQKLWNRIANGECGFPQISLKP